VTFRRLAARARAWWVVPVLLLMPFVTARTAARRDGGAEAAAITRASWTSIGPGNIGGRVRALAVHPTTTSTIFVGGANGGIWRSTDSGASWQPIDDYLPSLAITTIVFRPGTSSTMYAGTGESFSELDGARGAGILKSTNSGAAWAVLPSTSTADFYYVNRLAMSADGSILLAATSTGLFRSTDQGSSFTKVLTVSGLGYSEVGDVKFLAGSSTAAVAAGNSQNAYVSTDAGVTWLPATGLTNQTTQASAPQGVEIGVAGASSSTTVYLSINSNTGEVWKSTNGGASYAKVGTPGHLTQFGSSANAIWVDPTNASTVVIGGDDLYRSTNGGSAWTKISARYVAPALSTHGQQHVIAADPGFNGTTNRRVYFGNDGGAWTTSDIYAAPQNTGFPCCNSIPFTSLNNGLTITQFYGGAGSAINGKILGGSQGNGSVVYTPAGGAQAWTVLSGNQQEDAGYAAIDSTDPSYLYGSFAYLRLYRSADGGASASYILGADSNSVCKPPPYRIDDACNGTTNYTAPFVLDPSNPNRLLAGGVSLWRSDDVKADLTETTGPHWAAIKAPSGSSPINALAIAAGHSDVVWVGHNNGDVYVTANGTAGSPSWQKVDGSALPDRTVTAIAVDSRNTQVAYVGFDGFNTDNLWKTTNNGTTWTALTGLPAIPVHTLTIDPRASEFLFLGTDAGVFTSRDGGATWDGASVGPANTAVDQLFAVGSTLVAATHGRGMFTTPVVSPVSASPASLSFTASRSSGGDANLGLTPPQSVTPTYAGGGTPSWSASADQAWISVSAGSSPGTWSVAIVNPGNVIGTSSSLSGTVTLSAANVGTSVVIPVTLTVLTNGASDVSMSLDTPSSGASVLQKGFVVAGWALDRGSAVGVGIDAVHVWAYPLVNGSLGTPVFVGAVGPSIPRPDVGGFYGSQFTNSGFALIGNSLSAGSYRVFAFAHSVVTNSFSSTRSVDITVSQSDPQMSLDVPADGSAVTQPFVVGGWAIDFGATSGTGVDAVHVWAQPSGGGAATFVGVANYSSPRGDIGSIFGGQFTNSGFGLVVSGLSPGTYTLMVFAHSSVTGTFNQARLANVTVAPSQNMSLDYPASGATFSGAFVVAGWAIDRSASSGTGVDTVHVWAFPTNGDTAIFAGSGGYGVARSDVGAAYGSQFTNSGFQTWASGLPPGTYTIVVYAHSAITGTFNQSRSIQVTIQ
jgi:hypothetical protein